jgi:cystathionine beta-lyase family protein involved in aluminum resistance
MDDIFQFSEKVNTLSERALEKAKGQFENIERIAEYNQQKVLSAFINHRVSEAHLGTSTGYGYGDTGRDTLDRIVADVFNAEDAVIRTSLVSGTHTLCVALFGILRTGDTLLCVSGTPYDTLHSTIGINEEKTKGTGTLRDFGINYREIALLPDESFDIDEIKRQAADEKVKMVYIQRSRGYAVRHSLSVDEIKEVCDAVHSVSKNAIVFVDNCYGEFVETKEPTDVGADLTAGSLIKNMGGGVALCGGYIAGRHDLVELCTYRMTTPGLGREVGASLNQNRNLYMGLFHAPHVVGEALKTAVFASALFDEMGFDASPRFDEKRNDIVQLIMLKNPENLCAFCRGIQKGSPVDSFVTPEPWDMPGYDSKVIMAAGTFTGGSSIELSADAPLREPFAVWMQGGLNFASGKTAVKFAAEEVENELKKS